MSHDSSMGENWRAPFHPDDMPSTNKKWAHSLRTGVSILANSLTQHMLTEFRMSMKANAAYDVVTVNGDGLLVEPVLYETSMATSSDGLAR